MNNSVNQENINRFNGFSDIYNNNRPKPPDIIAKAIVQYLEREPEVVVDIGSGTGLSTKMWVDYANTIIGIEPNNDMRNQASQSIKSANISFSNGLANETGIADNYADVVTVSQAFHWFDIDSTLAEVYRILKDGGVFAVYDCDWPPVVNWEIESAYNVLHRKCDDISLAMKKPAIRNDKSSYIKRLNEFGRFKFVKEIVCHSVESANANRIKKIALSQGSIQSAMKNDVKIINDINAFFDLVDNQCKGEFNIIFSYRVRLGIK